MFNVKLFFLIFCTVFVGQAAQAQAKMPVKALSITLKTPYAGAFKSLSINKITTPVKSTPVFTIIAPNFYTANFGFFCRQELKIEKAVKIPLRFRLGSVVACDRFEGKQVSITQY